MAEVANLRGWLSRQPKYLDLRWNLREGLLRALRRSRIQRRILNTPPLSTASDGPIEIRVLTWRRDWINLVWALKSFYFFSGVDYPLFIHDGGLLPENVRGLRRHFPKAHIVSAAEADVEVSERFRKQGLSRCLAYRSHNVPSRKLFDFFSMSQAECILIIDSDIVFFQKPVQLCASPDKIRKNIFHKDQQYGYALTVEEMESSFGINPVCRIACGLGIVKRESIKFADIERWLANPKLFDDAWLGEQTLHALCSTVYGVEFLPDTYRVSTESGLSPELVCKHYPGFFRPLLYEEGMSHLIQTGFLDNLRRSWPSADTHSAS
jgi:hypothetical protein